MAVEPRSLAKMTIPPRRGVYLKDPLPSRLDKQIRAALDALDGQGLEDAAREFTPHNDTLLPTFGERMAIFAVRNCDLGALRAGLRACAVAHEVDDYRDVVGPIGLLWHSAIVLGLDPEDVFTSTAQTAGRFGEVLRRFAQSKPEDRSLEAMRYTASGEGPEFTYHRTW
jgi:hypothetical protein